MMSMVSKIRISGHTRYKGEYYRRKHIRVEPGLTKGACCEQCAFKDSLAVSGFCTALIDYLDRPTGSASREPFCGYVNWKAADGMSDAYVWEPSDPLYEDFKKVKEMTDGESV
jgi:hypothetical protein